MKKMIYINGPSFGGKSFLHNKLSILFNSKNIKYSNVCFEQYYQTYNAELAFYKAIEAKVENGVVLAESVQFNQLDPFYSLSIICLPTVERHEKNMLDCESTFGKDYIHSRTFGFSVLQLRRFFAKDYIKNPHTLQYDGTNLEEIYHSVVTYGNK